jgi:hypothetical protein
MEVIMNVLSTTCLLCTLPSGNKAVYALQPQHLNEIPGITLNERAICYGEQIAVLFGDRWFKAGGREEITDLRTIALLERCPDA